MRPTRVALLIAATALTPALLLTAPAFAAGTPAPAPLATSATPITPITPTPATACPADPSTDGTPVDQLTEDQLRAALQDVLADPNAGRAVLREAGAALGGTADGTRAFFLTGCRTAQAEDDSFTIARILSVARQNGDTHVQQAGSDALDAGTPEALRAFLETGYAFAQTQDNALAVARILSTARQNGDKHVQQAASDALDAGTAEALSDFRWTGYRLAQAQDDALYIVRMLNDPDISDAMVAAIQAVLDDGSPEALRQFRTVGQYEVDG
ncbi:ALF repeat-containing protein [Streptomyces sp. NPDC004031]